MNFDENEIRKAFAIINPDLVEIRIIGANYTASGYFKDADTLIKELHTYDGRTDVNFYMVMNQIEPACYSRRQMNCIVAKPKETTSDKDIIARRWLMLDFDCDRPSGVSSNKEELDAAKKKAWAVYQHLASIGFSKPVIAISGNGYHLMYRIDMPNNEDAKTLVQDCLNALDMLFTDEKVKIDTAVYNSSRITKLYGTYARKGQSTEDRPHRLSRIIEIPEEIKTTPVEVMLKLASIIPVPEEKPQYKGYSEEFDLETWISKHGLPVSKKLDYQGGTKWIIRPCPFNNDHDEAAIIKRSNGAIQFHCFHSSCSQYDWKYLRRKYEPDFYTSDMIKAKNRDNLVSIKTGIYELDRKLIGLNKGEVSVVSGVNGSGKSSVLSQVSLDVINQGYKVAMFSGEHGESEVLGWLQLQAAGKLYNKPTQYENYYYVPDDIKPLINNWLQDRMYVYNNRKGNEIEKILSKIGECISKNKVDLLILDNLMAMNLDAMSGDKYEKQSKFSKRIDSFAKQADVHVVLVAHPRKSIGFIRKDDISGTADITNMVDNVFIVHRVNNDFRRLGAQTFGWKLDEELFQYSNVIEVCKNRDLGVQDLFVGLYYEPESKRFLNDRYEMKHFKWEDQIEFKLPIGADDNEYRLPFDLN